MMRRTRLATLGMWIASLVACVLVITHTRFVSDLSAFLPQAPNARQQMLVEQLRDGIIARLVMVGIEGADATERARLSRDLAASLRANPAFIGVQNGEAAVLARDQAYFFDNRYLLNADVTPQRFTTEGLREAIGASLDALSGDAGLMLKRLLARDPTGETVGLLEQFAGDSQPRSLEGVWAARDGSRALLLIQTAAAGSDTDAQAAAIANIRSAFDQLPDRQADARLVMSGAGVFSVSSRNTIESEISRLALAGTLLVVCLLLAVYRSPRLLILGLLPVASGALVGIAAVSLGFGHVHGLTLAFGTTLIGESVDYSIYLFIQRAGGRDPRNFWRIIGLGVLTSIAGFAALLFSGFPGLAQLGLYSISGLVAAALVTRFVLPLLMPQQIALRDLSGISGFLQNLFKHAHRLRLPLAIVLIAAAGLLWSRGDSIWSRELSSLSPVSKADQDLDHALRADMGAPDMRYMVAFTAKEQETALQGAEKLGAALQTLIAQNVIGGFSSPAFVLPSQEAQEARRMALPEEAILKNNLGAALQGMPLKAERLSGFLTDVERTRARAPLARADLNGTSSSLLVDSLLVKRANDYLVLLPLRATGSGPQSELIDTARVDQLLAGSGVAGATVIDLLEESTSLYAGYLHEAQQLAIWGGLIIIVLMLFALRSLPRALRITAPLVCAVLCVAALLALGGRQMTILHLVGLLLVMAVGSNYALFFDSGAQEGGTDAERRQTLVSLVVANLTTVSSFGLLGFSQVSVLSAFGTTVGPGAFLALIFSAILARKQNHAHTD
ncbi:MMPL family transporter [Uliginosibacterium flavum]|uniref:MMPL family transporter n=1 Tax=Uliginosibacterium flavum TaxID=1396831 RepID=A0ABV2THQ0_9RHOO